MYEMLTGVVGIPKFYDYMPAKKNQEKPRSIDTKVFKNPYFAQHGEQGMLQGG